jgi:hypothetical protein
MTEAVRTHAGAMIGRSVSWRGVRLGAPIEVFLDHAVQRAIGLEVQCDSGTRRFLPFAACRLEQAGIVVTSPLALLEEQSLSFYRDRALPLTRFRGSLVLADDHSIGVVQDVVLGDEGYVEALVVQNGSAARELVRSELRLEREPAGRGLTVLAASGR